MTAHATRLQRLEVERRKQAPTGAQQIFDHGPVAMKPGQAFDHANVVAALQWRALDYTPPVEETRTNGRN